MRRTIDADGVELAVHEWGPADGRAVVFWPGLGSFGGDYLAEAAPILAAEHGLRVAGIDPPGIGGSPQLEADAYALDALAGLVPRALDQLGIARCVFLGHSWGGWIGMAAAPLGRFEGLALIDSGYLGPADLPAAIALDTLESCTAFVRSSLWRCETVAELDELIDTAFPAVTTQMRAVLHTGVRPEGGVLVDTMSAEMGGAAMFGMNDVSAADLHLRVAGAEIPVLLLAGTAPVPDEALEYLGLSAAELDARRRSALTAFGERVPGADVRQLRHWGHEPIPEHSRELAEIVGRWAATI